MSTVERDEFEWDDAKAHANVAKHGVTFDEACTVFEDLDYLLNLDPVDSARFIAVGLSSLARVLVVVHGVRAEGLTQNPSALPAERYEGGGSVPIHSEWRGPRIGPERRRRA